MPSDTAETALATLSKGNPFVVVAVKAIEHGGASELAKVMDLAERWEANRAKSEYSAAMVAIQNELPTVVSDKHNNQTGSRYPSMEKVMATLKPIALKHGVTYSFHEGGPPDAGMICVVGIFRHSAGHSEIRTRYGKIDNVGLKGNPNSTEIQGAQKSVTYLSRRMICSEFGIVVADEDRDGNRQVETVTEEQARELSDLLAATGGDWVRLLTVSGVEPIPVPDGADVNEHVWNLLLQVPASRFEKSRDLMKRAKSKVPQR